MADDLIVREDQREVLEALRRLPRRQRDRLVLHYVMELTVPAIADTLGLSVNSVKTHLRRAKAALTVELEGLMTVGLSGLVVVLGPLIRRFGQVYVTDVYRATPHTGAALLPLMDIAY